VKVTGLSVSEDVEKTRREVMKRTTTKEFDEKFDNGEDADVL